jgi:hypothetical protein
MLALEFEVELVKEITKTEIFINISEICCVNEIQLEVLEILIRCRRVCSRIVIYYYKLIFCAGLIFLIIILINKT